VPAFDADYWVSNLRKPVRFSQAITAAAQDHATFVEVSPHPLLTHAIDQTLASTSPSAGFVVTSAMKRGEDETLSVHTQLATLGVTEKSDGRRLADVPSTPWQHSSYWVEKQRVSQRVSDVHPLLGVHVELPTGRDHAWQADIGFDTMGWLAEHKVNGQSVMPAAAFAEMALAAGCQALARPAETIAISDLDIENMLALDGQTRIAAQLAQGDNGVRVEIHASSAGGRWRRYAVCNIADVGDEAPDPQLDAGAGIEILLPDDADEHPQYRLQPVLLDAALQRLAADAADGSETPYLPASLATVRVFGPLGRRVNCHTELQDVEGIGQVGRILLTDDAGNHVAELTGVRLQPVDPRTVALPLEQKIFDTEWVENSAPSGQAQPAAEGSWLLLADDDAGTKALVAEFSDRFSSATRRVVSAPLFANEAVEQELSPVGIVIFVGKRSFDGTDPDGALERARELILTISAKARGAVDAGNGKPPRLWLVTRDGLAVHDDEAGDPAIGALKGVIRNWRFPGEAARVLAGEPDVGATLVDLDGTDDLQKLVAALTTELESPSDDDVIAWREDRRYVERLTRASLEHGRQNACVRADGSYIVTGGLGGLGTVVTRWLTERGAGRLILNGRTEPSAEQLAALADLADGIEIDYVAGDIASPGVAEQLVAAAEQTGLPLCGVVHAAGITGDGLVTAVTEDGLERVWAPKVAGALRLHAATATRQLDWWVGFSSMATLLGLPGQLAYTTANAWFDALVAWRRASGLPATAINWGQWSDVGMSRSLTYSVLDPIAPEEGIEALDTLVGGDLVRVGVGRLRLDRAAAATPEFRELGYFEKLVAELDASGVGHRPAADAGDQSVAAVLDWSQIPAENIRGELEMRLKTILARELRMSASAVDADQPFPELGLDSMMAMTVLKETQKLASTDLSANTLFNHPTISSLSAYLADAIAAQHIPSQDEADQPFEPASSVLDELFDSVESASAGSESGVF
ncbi:MAG TPA: SDR family NAD(P)-dependent oxidoreductase, partial [Mycobacterium sp.]